MLLHKGQGHTLLHFKSNGKGLQNNIVFYSVHIFSATYIHHDQMLSKSLLFHRIGRNTIILEESILFDMKETPFEEMQVCR